MTESQQVKSRMMYEKAVNVSSNQVTQILECHGKDLGIYTESKRELFKSFMDTSRSFIGTFTGYR